jgi:hypothetical protein
MKDFVRLYFARWIGRLLEGNALLPRIIAASGIYAIA